ncbi:MAG TPA: winged helix-turn-helix domain-containing protein [Streptosporangiaceae bacterium]|nr:winged helix-turn-helix domain-containing protein [Streptosporangiaceae bacterium]
MDFSGVRLHGYYEWPFEQIAAVIEDAVRSGELQPHQQIPTEKDIQDLTGASRGTVRHAMELLRERGLIYARAHLGSFVAGREGERP